MGLLALALENTPAFPTFPRRMNEGEIGAGLALPFAAETIAGKGGAGAGTYNNLFPSTLGNTGADLVFLGV